MILGMPAFTFFIFCIIWPAPVIISAIIAFKSKKGKK
jgi:hypothetical protein